MFVYWIHLPEQTNVAIEGYVGIAMNFEQRMSAHKSCAKTGKEQNLYNAFFAWNRARDSTRDHDSRDSEDSARA